MSTIVLGPAEHKAISRAEQMVSFFLHDRTDIGRIHAEARAGGRLWRQRRPTLLGGHLRGGRARPQGHVWGGPLVRALVARWRPAGGASRDRNPRLGTDTGGSRVSAG